MQRLQAVFLDRDGTIGGDGHFIHPRDFELFPFSLNAIGRLKKKGLLVFAFTNQHRIARGQADEADFVRQFAAYGFDGSYICPHAADAGCNCHKPKPGMLLKAAREHGLDLTRCAVIGDVGSTDMLAAAAVGAVKIMVLTGWGKTSLEQYKDNWYDVARPDYIATDLADAVNWLAAQSVEDGDRL
ncbi:HAD-IIIA family hydrolase [Paenibacillus piri]|uniref:D,D-heptose 1,7-bisphosphate phosphatase n=1 Tax=Paenibacillus piri TaxID=2547395 RepID=A0A4R5KI15_9BACL|nr:HAD-IIIA family hydrolase [Paenibacillus piri]TDF95083.1 HAD-IIIA family hydrolase [Paenibacillus piri]